MVGEYKKVVVIFSIEDKCDSGKCKLAILSACKILEQMVKESSLKTLGVRENWGNITRND